MLISIETAISLLKAGKVVALPTETVYGLAASICCPKAIEAIFSIKNRPITNPLIVHLSNAKQLIDFVPPLPKDSEKLIESFWPGPLTLVVKSKEDRVPANVRANLPTVALRIPTNEITLKIIEAVGPLVMPSANISGKPSATCAAHVEKDFGQDFPVVDGGFCLKGIESTILVFDYEKNMWQLARLGAIAPEAISQLLGYPVELFSPNAANKPICPGQMFRHYAPEAKIHLCKDFSNIKDSAILGFSDRKYPASCQVFCLGNSNNCSEIAGNLYRILRQLDIENIHEVYCDINFSNDGLFKAIFERIKKASRQ